MKKIGIALGALLGLLVVAAGALPWYLGLEAEQRFRAATAERNATGSVVTAGRFQPPGGGFGKPSRIRSHCHAQKLARPPCG